MGILMNLGLSMVGATAMTNILTKYGRDKPVTKGLFFGVSMGGIINAVLSGLSSNKVKPKDAASNLSYISSNAVYGVTAALIISKLGHDSIFDTPPQNDYLKPTEKTTEELRLQKNPSAAK